VGDGAPDWMRALDPDDLRALQELLRRVTDAGSRTAPWAEVSAEVSAEREH
jgi:hypothetical protein